MQTAYFNGRYSYDLHTGYCYTKEDSHGFVSLSDSSDHTASAIHNALKPKIEALVAKGKKQFIICSDSPSGQYRNSKNVILMQRLCAEFGISIRLLFTEAAELRNVNFLHRANLLNQNLPHEKSANRDKFDT